MLKGKDFRNSLKTEEYGEKMESITNIPFELNLESLLQSIRVQPGTEDAKEFEDLIEEVRRRARPKALYKESYVESKGWDTVIMDGITFTSRALRNNLDRAERVFPHIATCGRELDEIDLPPGDFLKPFWLDTIKGVLLGASLSYLKEYLDRKYALGKTSTMSPGAGDVEVWPIEQQRELFSLFGNVEERIGVHLTDSFLMVPNKTVSAIRFPTEIDFRSCQVCRRGNCPSRSAPLDMDLWESIQHDIASEV